MIFARTGRRVLSMLMAVVMIFGMVAVVLPTQAEAATLVPNSLIKANGSALTEDELRNLLEEAYQSVEHYSYGLLTSVSPYADAKSTVAPFNCASFVTYMYSWYIGYKHGFRNVYIDGQYPNKGILPAVPSNKQTIQSSYTKGDVLGNANYVGSWYEFIAANPGKWGTVQEVGSSMTAEQIMSQLKTGSLLFFTNTGSLSGITSAANGASHIGIYSGDGYIYHCTSDGNAGVTKEAFSTRFNKLGVKALAGWVVAEFIPDTGIIEIEKVDGSSNGLPGAKFNIVAVDVPGMTSGTIVTTIETGSNGKATVEKLPYGTYTITETQAPTGYALNNTVYGASPATLSVRWSGSITRSAPRYGIG